MSYFWMAALLLLAAAWMTRPYWRPTEVTRLRRKAANVAVYRSRLAELEAEVAAGTGDPEALAALRQELDARLVRDAEGSDGDLAVAAGPRGPRPLQALLLTLVLAVFAAGVYYLQDSWRTEDLIELARKDPEAGQQLAIQAMVDRLAKRLADSPEDAEGWAMLGRSYVALERHEAAARAFAEANRRVPSPQPELLVSEGEALAMASADRSLQGRPRQLFEAALAVAPNDPKALWYAGLSAAQAGDYRQARSHWLKLREQALPPELTGLLDDRLRELGVALNEPYSPPQAAPDAASGASLDVQVALAPALQGKQPPGSTLFVFAKAAEGPPMPLAARKLGVGELPAQIRLDDSMAMLPQFKLSQFDRWVVTARISASGAPVAQPGDWEGTRTVSRVESAHPIVLTIDTVVP